jgi:ABC transport system ATP-binding/permease protein
MKVGKLSGGEQSRLLLALLMLNEANLFILDEPTNDLDIATLDMLQETLQEIDAAIILVTHDRFFLDQVATQILAFEFDSNGRKKLVPYSGLTQWTQAQAKQKKANSGRALPTLQTEDVKSNTKGSKPSNKLSYNDQREYDSIEKKIHELEAKLEALTSESSQPSLSTNSKKLGELAQQMGATQKEIDRLYARWQELESFLK